MQDSSVPEHTFTLEEVVKAEQTFNLQASEKPPPTVIVNCCHNLDVS